MTKKYEQGFDSWVLINYIIREGERDQSIFLVKGKGTFIVWLQDRSDDHVFTYMAIANNEPPEHDPV